MEDFNRLIEKKDFEALIHAIGFEIEHAQVKLIVAANTQMLFHYWKLGNFILYHQKRLGWGGKVISRISQAIKMNYPEKKGYSSRNLTYMCQFARLYSIDVLQKMLSCDRELETPTIDKVLSVTEGLDDLRFAQELPAQTQTDRNQLDRIAQELPAQIENIDKTISMMLQISIEEIENVFIYSPISKVNWASHLVLLDSSLSLGAKYWYIKQSVEVGWSSNVLKIQIENNLFKRQIEAQKISNFTTTLPVPQSDLANYLLKDPYIFDVAGTKELADERDIEKQLVEHVTRYLLEMGNGFAFVAKQKHFQVGDSDFYADLILYNIKLHAYIVAELKATPFKPEYAGQLNFYVNIVDNQLRGENDNKTIGLLLCKGKDEVVAQYSLTGYTQPIGISDYQLSKAIPENLKSALPTIEEVEEELSQLLDKKKNR
ncbi:MULTISPECIES: YhcG family protein [unclassified Bacteroides]|jgi:predicted nuclease of restriction endonuclease-like (RecB) superfamily|uniref:PDDEXK nuclease domain-containing protein n=1 Tax=unclassified Bacteroides TaxID=2646097 RepID=UPI000E996CED|nr:MULTISPECIES: PDDEXK nuclease domain-containing protein [unclassified Bacteroides]RGN50888.1 DUF1016 family protein [Bacteroides sp. OM05-12]RHR82175.1 DUF1016 family protein [Bacteroides sp. AF16-49]